MAKHFFTKGLNTDDAPHLIESGHLINGENIRMAPNGMLENILGTFSRAAALPAGDNKCIGAVADNAGKYVVYFVWNSNNDHRIFLWYSDNSSISTVMSGSILGFDKESLVHSAAIINGIVYWTDGLNEPRKINLGAVIKMNHAGSSPIESAWEFTSITDPYEFTIIRRPPAFPPSIAKDTDADFKGSQIATDSFQFCTQYIYWDGENSVLSARSTSSKLNSVGEEYNKITVTLSLAEKIAQSVRIVRLIVRIGSTGKFFVIKEWDKMKDGAAITNHNSGAALTYDFYNNAVGEAIDAAASVAPFHNVPLISKTLAGIKNRIFLGNNTEGYDTPLATSLQVELGEPVAIGGTSFNKTLYQVKIYGKRDPLAFTSDYFHYVGWWVFISGEFSPAGYYALTGTEQIVQGNGSFSAANAAAPTLVAAPSTVAVTGLRWLHSSNWFDASWYVREAIAGITDYNWITEDVTSTSNIASVTGLSTITAGIFKSLSKNQSGVVFYDKAMRCCGVVTKDDISVDVPPRDFAFTEGITSIKWTLDNASAVTEIPEWAYYYSVVMTKNLRTRNFVQSYDGAAKYAVKNIDGNYDFTHTTVQPGTVGIALDMTGLWHANLGYVFTEGDLCTLIGNDDVVHHLPIISQDEKYLIVDFKDLGDLSTKQFIYEVYTPYTKSSQEPFYEMGQVYFVTNPGEAGRVYSQLNGSFLADCYCLTRNYNSATYFAEASCPIDKFFSRWDTDHGRPNLVTNLGKAVNKTSVRFSNVYIPGTSTNGLSAFEALNEELLPLEMNSVQKLIPTSKSQTTGNVLLAIGESETASLYIGEAQMSDNAGNTFLVKTTGVIGQVNVLQGSLGTQNPESVQAYRGRVFWFDVLNACVASYSSNGLFPISNNKLKVAVQKFAAKYQVTIIDGDLTGYRPFVVGGIDPVYGEYLLSIPQTEDSAPAGTLTDPAIDNPYDFYDGKAKTWVYRIELDQWTPSHIYSAEAFATLGDRMYSFKTGAMYEHNHKDAGYNSFHGAAATDSKIMFVENGDKPDSTMKIAKGLQLEANQKPSYTHIRTEVPNIQSSDLVNEWVTKEGIHYAAIRRDRLSPNAGGDGDVKLLFGDEMRGQWLKVMMQFSGSAGLLQIRFVGVTCSNSTGHIL